MKTTEELKKEIFHLDMRINCLKEELDIKVGDITKLYKYRDKIAMELKMKVIEE